MTVWNDTRRRGVIAVLAATLVTLAACAGTPEPETVTVEVTPDVTADKSAVPDPAVPVTWPLTGVAAEVVERPALSIKIENSAASRPQTGLQAADVVWEQMVEGGITRFNAVYHSTLPEVVGPVRSVRPMDAAISAPFGGLLVFSGGQAPFIGTARDAGLQVLSNDAGDGGFYRSRDRFAPHNLYGEPQAFLDQADGAHSTPPTEQFAFARSADRATAVVSGTPASSIATTFPRAQPSWAWDAAAGRWLRSEGGAEAQSTDTGRIGAVNVVALRVDVVTTRFTDPSGAHVPETVLTGSGEAVVATGGHTLTGTWTKPDAASPVALTTADGEVIELAPGNTWVELVPTSGGSVTVG